MRKLTEDFKKRTLEFATSIEKIRPMVPKNLYVYNPLIYAGNMQLEYIDRFAVAPTKIMFLGMNPGPFGMTQTGIPFGEVSFVKNFLRIDVEIGKPKKEHPSRPVLGLDCKRSEVSGFRFWSLMKEHYKKAENMIGEVYVANYCPLIFMEDTKTAKNITPDKLSKEIRLKIGEICDEYLWDSIELLECEYLIGIGKYAEKKLKNDKYPYSSILHPSPASPLANKGWGPQAESKLKELKVWQ